MGNREQGLGNTIPIHPFGGVCLHQINVEISNQDPPSTLNWGCVAPDGGYLGPSKGLCRCWGLRVGFSSSKRTHKPSQRAL